MVQLNFRENQKHILCSVILSENRAFWGNVEKYYGGRQTDMSQITVQYGACAVHDASIRLLVLFRFSNG